jgi:hypothetical protein
MLQRTGTVQYVLHWQGKGMSISPVKAHCFCQMSITFLEGSQASPTCLSEKSSVNMKMNVDHMWNTTDRWVAYREEHINADQILARKSEG